MRDHRLVLPGRRGARRSGHTRDSRPRREIRAGRRTARSKLDARELAMQETARTIKPLSNFIYRAMQVGVLLIAAGTILGGVWADYSWGRFWGWDSEGSLGPDHPAGLPGSAPRPLRRLGEHVRAGRRVDRLLPLGGDGLVRRQLRPRRRPAQLRLRRRRLSRLDERDHPGRPRSPVRRLLAQEPGIPAVPDRAGLKRRRFS